MSWLPFVSRRRYQADLDAVNADRERIRGERDQFAKDRDAHKAAATTSARLFAEADAALTRVNGRARHLAELLVARDRVPRSRLRIARKAAARILAAYTVEKRRADGLQTRLDHALGLGLNDPAVEAGQHWQARRMDKPHPSKETS